MYSHLVSDNKISIKLKILKFNVRRQHLSFMLLVMDLDVVHRCRQMKKMPMEDHHFVMVLGMVVIYVQVQVDV